jgi:SMI1/KNR4 family protein SUKH-1
VAVEWIDRLRAYRGAQGLLNGELPTVHDVENFETRFGVALPLDLREYFLHLNGTAGGRCAMDGDELISFWRLDELVTLASEGVIGLKNAEDWFVLADYSIWAHCYAIRLSPDRNAETPVAISYNPPTFQVTPTMPEFIDAYLRHDYSVLFASLPDQLAADV